MVTLFDNFDKTMSHQSQIIAKDHSTGMGFNGHNGSTSEAKQRINIHKSRLIILCWNHTQMRTMVLHCLHLFYLHDWAIFYVSVNIPAPWFASGMHIHESPWFWAENPIVTEPFAALAWFAPPYAGPQGDGPRILRPFEYRHHHVSG